MGYSLDDVGKSWRSTLLFLVAVGAALLAMTYTDGAFGVYESVLWWMGALIAVVALVTTYVRQREDG